MSEYKFGRRQGIVVAVTILVLLTSMAISAPTTQPAASGDSQRASNARYEKAIQPAEALMADWDFAAAKAALAKLSFKERALSDRLIVRRDEVMRLAKLKGEIVSRARSGIKLGGAEITTAGGKKIFIGERITKADEKGLTIEKSSLRASSSRRETWAGMNKSLIKPLLKAVVAGDNSEDQIAAGILCAVQRDTVSAAEYFRKAKSLGANTEIYLGPLAAATFADAQKLLDKKQYAKAQEALDILDKEYSNTPWYASYKQDIAAARAKAKTSLAASDTEELYAKAVEFFKATTAWQKDPVFSWDLKFIVDKLKAEYADSAVVTDITRSPSFADLVKAVAEPGKFLVVRQDGKGDFTSIQAAVKAAPPNSLIEIHDTGIYSEKLVITEKKTNLTVRGKDGCWPVITSYKAKEKIGPLVSVQATGTILGHLLVIHTTPRGVPQHAIFVTGSLQMRLVVVAMRGGEAVMVTPHWGKYYAAENSIVFGTGVCGVPAAVTNSVMLGNWRIYGGRQQIQNSTILGMLSTEKSNVVVDCIASQIKADKTVQVMHCNLFGSPPFLRFDQRPKTDVPVTTKCILGSPGFSDPKKLDFRLKGKTCRGKASDGGDIGVRFTPEMLEMLDRVRRLQKKGIIQF